MAGAGDIDHVEIELLDQPIEVRIDEVESRRRAPVPEQARLDVLLLQRLAQQRIVEQVDLADGQIVRGAPVGVDERSLFSVNIVAMFAPPSVVRRGLLFSCRSGS